MRTYMICVLFLIGLVGDGVFAPPPRSTSEDPQPFSIFAESDEIGAGYVIINGEYVARPYVLVRKDDTVFINNRPLPRTHAQPTNFFALIEQTLQNDGLLIAANDRTYMLGGQSGRAVAEALVVDGSPETIIANIQSHLGGKLSATLIPWTKVVATVTTDETFRKRLRTDLGMDDSEAATSSFSAAGAELPQSQRFWLNAAGMVLAVVALAHVLMYRPELRGKGASRENFGDGYKLLPRFIMVVVILSLFDLAYTMLADRAGGFWEMNPLASSLMQYPVALIAFKITATLLGASLLLRLRKYHAAQFASWCVCLVYTMLTFRWAIYNSLFFG